MCTSSSTIIFLCLNFYGFTAIYLTKITYTFGAASESIMFDELWVWSHNITGTFLAHSNGVLKLFLICDNV